MKSWQLRSLLPAEPGASLRGEGAWGRPAVTAYWGCPPQGASGVIPSKALSVQVRVLRWGQSCWAQNPGLPCPGLGVIRSRVRGRRGFLTSLTPLGREVE